MTLFKGIPLTYQQRTKVIEQKLLKKMKLIIFLLLIVVCAVYGCNSKCNFYIKLQIQFHIILPTFPTYFKCRALNTVQNIWDCQFVLNTLDEHRMNIVLNQIYFSVGPTQRCALSTCTKACLKENAVPQYCEKTEYFISTNYACHCREIPIEA